MDDSELEARLRRRLHERFDGHRAPSELRASVTAGMAAQPPATRRRVAFHFLFAGSRQLLAATAVVVVVVIVGLALTGRDGSVGVPVVSPSPSVSPLPTATAGGSPSTPVASATPDVPQASVPPISTAAWSGLAFQHLQGAPELSTVVPWAGGYIAISGSNSAGQLGAWLSRDGRAWTELPATTFGLDDPTHNTFVIGGTACGSGVLIAGEDASGTGILWFSQDGYAWRKGAIPGAVIARVRESMIAGSRAGAVVANEDGPVVDMTSDYSSWLSVPLPGPLAAQVSAVGVFGTGFVALDASSPAPGSQPGAWWSNDGENWSAATVQQAKGNDFQAVWTGTSGLLAMSTTGDTPGLETLWSSKDGHAWVKDDAADPFGARLSGEGVGDPAGSILGDGTRFLAYGSPGDAADKPIEYLASPDGVHWTRLAPRGDLPTGLSGALEVFQMRDGVLISGDAGSWFATAVTN
jgi:hypothetical protein